MAATTPLSLPDDIRLVRCDLWLENPGRLGDRIGTYGHFRPHLARGQRFWRAEIEIPRILPAQFDEALAMESLISKLQTGDCLKVPVWRRNDFHRCYELAPVRANNAAYFAATQNVAVSPNGTALSGALGGAITLKPGCFFTLKNHNQLYQYRGDGEDFGSLADPGVLTAGNTEPPWPTGLAGQPVELHDPYFIGILREGATPRLPRETYMFGPWDLELVEVART